MKELIITVNQYPWDSCAVFVGLYIILELLSTMIVNIIIVIKNKSKQ